MMIDCRTTMKSILLLVSVFASIEIMSQTTTSFLALKDNSIYSEDTTLSNGSGEYIFAGATASSDIRRAFIQFDISSIPDNAIITVVNLTFFCSNANSNNNVYIHRLNDNWGEGGSDAPGAEGQGAPAQGSDVTWSYQFFDTVAWTLQGGDFVGVSSGATVASVGTNFSFVDAGLLADVQSWVDGTNPNFGWILLGDEEVDQSASRFNSRENTFSPPLLQVTYTTPSPCVMNDTISGVIPSDIYSVSNNLYSDGQVLPDSVVVFEAGNSVELWSDFEVSIQGEFEIIIQPCN